MEDDAHLFFHCNLPRAVWFSFSPSIRTDTLPQENDGVQLILQSLISNSIPDALFHKILFTLWYIWKARNDRHFRGHTWTPGQVNNAVAGHIKSNAQAKLLQATPSASTHTDADTMLQYHTYLSQGTLHYLAGPSTASHQSQQIAANTTSSPTHLGLQGMVPATQQTHMRNGYVIANPTLLHGTRCYVDASTEPDQLNSTPARLDWVFSSSLFRNT